MDNLVNNIELETLKTLQNDWSVHYRALIEFCRELGHCNVPRTSTFKCTLVGICADGGDYHYTGSLGNWLHRQRKAKKKTGDLKITPARELLLQKLADEGKFLWSPNDLNSRSLSSNNKRKISRLSSDKNMENLTNSLNLQNEVNWNIYYAALMEYSKEHCHCNVPVNFTYQCTLVGLGDNGTNYNYQGNLGNWLSTQKQAKSNQGVYKITKEREELLQKLVDDGKLNWGLRSCPSIMKALTNCSSTPQSLEHSLPPLLIQQPDALSSVPLQPLPRLLLETLAPSSQGSRNLNVGSYNAISFSSNHTICNNFMQTALNVGYNIETATMIQNSYAIHTVLNTHSDAAVIPITMIQGIDITPNLNNMPQNVSLNMESNIETALAMQNNNNMQTALNMGYKLEMDMLIQKNKEIAVQNEMNYLVYLIDTNL